MPKSIDDSHHSFKHTDKFGPGPAGRIITQKKEVECERRPPKDGYYIQSCRYISGEKIGKKFTVKTDIEAKSVYNKAYNIWRKSEAGEQSAFLMDRPARRGYKCRPTSVSKCNKAAKAAKASRGKAKKK